MLGDDLLGDYVPDSAYSEHRRYEVRLTYIDGSQKVFKVITDHGPLKAVYMAGSSLRSAFAKMAYEVSVEDIGPVELDDRGVAKLYHHIIDRMEW